MTHVDSPVRRASKTSVVYQKDKSLPARSKGVASPHRLTRLAQHLERFKFYHRPIVPADNLEKRWGSDRARVQFTDTLLRLQPAFFH